MSRFDEERIDAAAPPAQIARLGRPAFQTCTTHRNQSLLPRHSNRADMKGKYRCARAQSPSVPQGCLRP